jgi:ASC-1-like (ASCH) protein
MQTKTLWVRQEYLNQILSGRKTIEVRVAYKNIARLQVGDRLMLNDRFPFCVRRTATYPGFVELLDNEDPASIAPELTPHALLTILQHLYPPEKEALGVVALEIEPERARVG